MSVSSLEGSPVPLDLAAKYQKVTSAYAKIRAQCGVLKKAVVDEQNHSAELKETLRIKDQNLRKIEQELDSLNFRNQQLTKRVTILQDELDSMQNSSKRDKSKATSRDIPNSILAEELQKKIAENEQLVSQIQEQNEKYEKEKFRLIQMQEVTEHELEECKKKLVAVEETKLCKLECENKQLTSKLSAKEEAMQKLNNEIKMLKNKTNGRNIEPEVEDWKGRFIKLLQTLEIEELLRSIITFFRNFEIRYKKNIEKTSSEKFLKCIESHIEVLGEFVNSYSSLCISVPNKDFLLEFDYLSGILNSYILLLDELGLYLVSGKDEEITKIFMDIITSFKNHCVQFHSAMKLCLTSDKTESDSEECAAAFADVFRSLRSTCDFFSSSLMDREQTPVSEEDTDKEILASLSKIGMQSNIVYKKVTENKYLIRNVIQYQSKKQQPKNMESEEGGFCRYCKEKCEAIKAAHLKKIKDLEEQISCLSGATTPRSTHSGNTIQSPIEGKDKVTEISNTFGILVGPSLISSGFESQEAELSKYFNARANALIADRQFAESKVTAFKSECEALQKRLEHSMDCRKTLEASVKQSQDTITRLQEELTTTTSNYELQLSSLSEHMANMNDKLTAQEEEIEILKYQLSEKGVKKGKSK